MQVAYRQGPDVSSRSFEDDQVVAGVRVENGFMSRGVKDKWGVSRASIGHQYQI